LPEGKLTTAYKFINSLFTWHRCLRRTGEKLRRYTINKKYYTVDMLCKLLPEKYLE